MQNLWQKKLKLNYSKDVFDIVQFGSSVMEGELPNDVDIAVIFHQISLKNQLNESQNIKKQIQNNVDIPVHVKSFDLYSFFNKSNFARESIFFGKSLIFGDYFSQRFGIYPRIHISYSLKDLKKKDKIRFNYLLSGKGGGYGLLRKYKGILLNPGLIEIFPEYLEIFTEAIKKIISKFEVRRVFLGIK